jgi:putative two-component system response regulator
MNVLLIEDDVDVAETVSSVLTNFFDHVEILHIVDGAGFHAGAWRNKDWSLVILDLMMPGITGFEVCERLRGFSATKKVPILALTGYDTLQNEEKIKAAGASGYMAKPFEVMKLKTEIDRLLTKAA